ncbi:DegV family protein [Streptococcus dysgalactiae]|uniref:DegV family fatty acid binding protein n=1 Tax=Streptococcus dysgalactiae subsp. equisimilis TaxID=119602 RepID=A0A9X8XG81_STREQ|nr:DegV family protein [Streptococcus dysgalactiae]MDO5365118.1 DegV family protein [Streptococcus dysgalactiae]MDY4034525.1 DegV family protein [Streptococcus dysgalactiae]QZT26830.1 DegV family protein [Streptococcus dysgalactiae]SQF67558.1 DegV family fatty acid binding protein [Streptococcus dysgalactiae subsp. equisimilis]VEF05789.1 DegV family fatty acid binding protein [Streptococcus dysgalactiae subsp. equisimilis]
MTWKIVTDSGCDLRSLESQSKELQFERVPLTLQIGTEIFRDDDGLDIDNMMATMYQSSKAATSSCPSPDAFLQAYKGVDNVIAVTITGTLSGSHNSARLAKNDLLEDYPNANIHVIDSLSASGEVDLIVLELERLINLGLSFEEVVEQITAYQEKTRLIFVLAKVDNLVKNGRLNKLVGKVVGLLNIRMVGQASQEGTLELLQKARGQKKAVSALVEEIQKAGYKGGKVYIAHANNPKICEQISEKIKAIYPDAVIQTGRTSGLCSFYAEDEGILMGYEI